MSKFHQIVYVIFLTGFQCSGQDLLDTILDLYNSENTAVTIDRDGYYFADKLENSEDTLVFHAYNWEHQLVAEEKVSVGIPGVTFTYTTPRSLVSDGSHLFFLLNHRFGTNDSNWVLLYKLERDSLQLEASQKISLDTLSFLVGSELGVDSKGDLRLAGHAGFKYPQSPTQVNQVMAFVQSYSAQLQKRWATFYFDSSGVTGNGLVPASMKFDEDDGVLITGNPWDPFVSRILSFALHIDSAGSLSWMVENPSGNINRKGMICSYRKAQKDWFCLTEVFNQAQSDYRFIVGTLDSTGHWQSSDTIGDFAADNFQSDITEVQGGYFLGAGHSYYGSEFSRFYKFSASGGDSIWSRDCQVSSDVLDPDWFTRVFEGPNGNFVLMGFHSDRDGMNPTNRSYLRILITDTNGCIGSNCYLGSRSNLKQASVVLYPNPAQTYVKVILNEGWQQAKAKELEYSLFNAQGVEVLSGAIESFPARIDLTSQISGVYILKLYQSPQSAFFQRLLIQN